MKRTRKAICAVERQSRRALGDERARARAVGKHDREVDARRVGADVERAAVLRDDELCAFVDPVLVFVLVTTKERPSGITDIAVLDKRAAVEDDGRVGGVHLKEAAVEFATGLERHHALPVVGRRKLRPFVDWNQYLCLARGIAAADDKVRFAVRVVGHEEVLLTAKRSLVEYDLCLCTVQSNPYLLVRRVGAAVDDESAVLVVRVGKPEMPQCLVDAVRGVCRLPDDGIEHFRRLARSRGEIVAGAGRPDPNVVRDGYELVEGDGLPL